MFFLKAVPGLRAAPVVRPIKDLLEKPSLQGIEYNSSSQILMYLSLELVNQFTVRKLFLSF